MAFAFALSTPALAGERDQGLFEFQDGDRVVLLGGTFIERMQTDGYFETLVTAAYPKRNITFRNLGWSGDTVWGDSRAVFGARADGFKRLVADVKLCEPTVIMVCYGANEAFAGEAGLNDFRAGLSKLLDTLEATGARIVLLGAPPRLDIGPPLPDPKAYNDNLRYYTQAVEAAARDRGHAFFDFAPRYEELLSLIKPGRAGDSIRKDGIYENGEIAALMLNKWLFGQPGVAVAWYADIHVPTGSVNATGVNVSQVKVAPDGFSFVGVARGARRLGEIRVRGMTPGTYRLLIDGKPADVNGGLRRIDPGDARVRLAHSSARWDELRETIRQKNELFFHRYRPQNETYLFLFRKHEQGNNAVEIPQFDPLIAEKEAEIAKLKQPVAQKFELVRVP